MDDPHSGTFTQNEPVRCARCGEILTLEGGNLTGACANCGATALAALLSGRFVPPEGARVGVVVCGGNTDPGKVASSKAGAL